MTRWLFAAVVAALCSICDFSSASSAAPPDPAARLDSQCASLAEPQTGDVEDPRDLQQGEIEVGAIAACREAMKDASLAAIAQVDLGRGLLRLGRDAEALQLFQTAAAAGSINAQYELGRLSYYGIGVDQDVVAAALAWKRAAAGGDANAASRLGRLYLADPSLMAPGDAARSYLQTAMRAGDRLAADHFAGALFRSCLRSGDDAGIDWDSLLADLAGWQSSKLDLQASINQASAGRLQPEQVDAVLAATADGISNIQRSLASASGATCALLRLSGEQSTGNNLDGTVNSMSSPNYISASQAALRVAGCYDGPIDARFGDATRKAWNRAAAKIGGLGQMSRSDVPTRKQAVVLLSRLDRTVCDAQPVAVDAVAFADALAGAGGKCPADAGAGAVATMAGVAGGGALIARGLQLLWSLPCPPGLAAVSSMIALSKPPDSNWHKVDLTAFVEPARAEFIGDDLLLGIGTAPDLEWGRKFLAKGLPGDKALLEAPSTAQTVDDTDGADLDLYRAYREALAGNTAPLPVAKRLLAAIDETESPTQTVFVVFMGSRSNLARLADLAAQFGVVKAWLATTKVKPTLTFAVATVLFEGRAPSGQNIPVGMELLTSAANRGLSEARYRLGVAWEYGYTGTADLDKAVKLYKLAADGGEAGASLALARLAETTNDEAKVGTPAALYAEAKDGVTSVGATSFADSIAQRIDGQSLFLSSSEGAVLLAQWAKADGAFAAAVGDHYACAFCGGVLAIDKAAAWYRRALAATAAGGDDDEGTGTGGAVLKLVKLLEAYPDVATSPHEAADLLAKATADGSGAELQTALAVYKQPAFTEATGAKLRASLGQICATEDCLELLHSLALGEFDLHLVPMAVKMLEDMASMPTSDYEQAFAVAAAADVLTFYGEYREAEALLTTYLERNPFLPLFDFTARNSVLQRVVESQAAHRASLDPDLLTLLNTLAKAGDAAAPDLLLRLTQPQGAVTPPVRKLEDAEASYQSELIKGGVGQGLVQTARNFAASLKLAGRNKDAVAYELIALNSQLQLNRASALDNGPVPALLDDVCTLSATSQRVMDLGFTDVAILLAKQAVNRLQEARAAIAALPPDFQLCFANVVGDSYRWLADLFIQQHDADDARLVLSMLKDFDTFQYLNGDAARVGRAFSQLSLAADEVQIQADIERVQPPFSANARRAQILHQQEAALTEAEKTELAQYDAAADQQRAAIASLVDDITKVWGPRVFNDLRYDYKQKIRDEYGPKAALIQYVVLPDSLAAILTTPTGKQTFRIATLDGQPFTEAALNAKIDALRSALADPGSNAKMAGQDLYQLLLQPFEVDLRDTGTTTILLSLDQRLRYMPFAALSDGQFFLAERFAFVVVSGAASAPVAAGHSDAVIAAFGVTKAINNLPPLKAVQAELDGIVDDGSGSGILKGRKYEDDAFTQAAFDAALSAMPVGKGVVHIASHFVLSDSPATSFLQLGNATLTVEQLDDDAAVHASLSNVRLVTLSACNSAYASGGGDGGELQDLANFLLDAGTQTVVGTLWQVSDSTTAAFMRRFYELVYDDGETPATAVSDVMREFVAASKRVGDDDAGDSAATQRGPLIVNRVYAHPHYWAPFVVIGGF